jgi:hypothetical protein
VTNAFSALPGNQLLLMMKPRRAGAGASTVTWRSV